MRQSSTFGGLFLSESFEEFFLANGECFEEFFFATEEYFWGTFEELISCDDGEFRRVLRTFLFDTGEHFGRLKSWVLREGSYERLSRRCYGAECDARQSFSADQAAG